MSVYRPTYRDPKTGETKQSRVWWYSFTFGGRRIQASSKSTRKTFAVDAEEKRRRELEQGFNAIADKRVDRIRKVAELAAEFLADYTVRNPRSSTFAGYALRHVSRLLGKAMTFGITEQAVMSYQTTRLKEGAAAKSVNEETGFLLRILGDQGDFLRGRLKKHKSLKLKASGLGTARAFTPKEKAALLVAARNRRSPAIYPALMLALNAGLRDAELRGLQWGRVDLSKPSLTVGQSKTDAGEGRTIPLNTALLETLRAYRAWYVEKFGETRPAWYVFPFGKPQPTDPTRPTTTLKTAWARVKAEAGVKGRWHDNRHTFITDLAESGEAADETIRDLAGHVSKRMLGHYSHIRTEAKRRAVEALVSDGSVPETAPSSVSVRPTKESTKVKV